MTDCILENTRSIDRGARGGPLQLQPTDGQTEPASAASVSQSVSHGSRSFVSERSPHACSRDELRDACVRLRMVQRPPYACGRRLTPRNCNNLSVKRTSSRRSETFASNSRVASASGLALASLEARLAVRASRAERAGAAARARCESARVPPLWQAEA